jgi:transposase-like protein
MQPGVSIAAVALANGLNANMLRKWVIETERGSGVRAQAPAHAAPDVAAEPPPGFIPLTMTREPISVEIRIELQRGATAVKVAWPTSAAAECAAWLRELLK